MVDEEMLAQPTPRGVVRRVDALLRGHEAVIVSAGAAGLAFAALRSLLLRLFLVVRQAHGLTRAHHLQRGGATSRGRRRRRFRVSPGDSSPGRGARAPARERPTRARAGGHSTPRRGQRHAVSRQEGVRTRSGVFASELASFAGGPNVFGVTRFSHPKCTIPYMYLLLISTGIISLRALPRTAPLPRLPRFGHAAASPPG